MTKSNFKLAMRSLRSTKWRSFLTMLGVVIGVMSVVTIVSLGEGVRQQLTRQIKQSGPNLITIRPGRLVERDNKGQISQIHYIGLLNNGSLSEDDLRIVEKTPDLELVVPLGLINGIATNGNIKADSLLLIGTNDQFPTSINQKILYGSFFTAADANAPAAVIGDNVSKTLFRQVGPIGQPFDVRGQEVIVRGSLAPFDNSPLTPGVDYNNAILMPYDFAKTLGNGQIQLFQIMVRPKKGADLNKTISNLTGQLASAHGGNQDFTILSANDNQAIASKTMTVLTSLIGGIAAISLLVGGIGIMNIMLVAVSERTHEIGVRKSVGATNRQILDQFLVEAVAISLVGGILGIIGSLIANYFLRLWTSLEPAISPGIMLAALVMSLAVGVFFGVTPAVKAARKDPIESLRRG